VLYKTAWGANHSLTTLTRMALVFPTTTCWCRSVWAKIRCSLLVCLCGAAVCGPRYGAACWSACGAAPLQMLLSSSSRTHQP
ncbi:hypothetical protein COO60DRAFT_1528219, partial [Scenedesmus sp. NREL 46B-D3]